MQDEILVPGVELLDSMRSVGYSFHAAIADLVDNSITAEARQIEIIGDPVESRYVSLLDDGLGMSADGARAALQLAGSARDSMRSSGDLGRFGLGLKTASLSQARQLTVLTKRDGVVTGLRWDIDHVRQTGEWSLMVLNERDCSTLPNANALLERECGTLVVWQELDYLLGAAARPDQVMAERLEDLRDHLSLTFHRFLDDGTRKPLRILVNGVPVKALDPFLSTNSRTQTSPVEPLSIGGQRIEFQAFTLPHHSALSKSERDRWDLGNGMRERQGFYIYRNKRLISYGHWYGLARREELSKQSRVRVDIPNTVDHLWQLDIKKSRAEPPQAFRVHFKRVMDQVIGKSKRVHTFRGRRESDQNVVRLWNKISDRDGYRYEINPEHPVVSAVADSVREEGRAQFRRLLTDLSQSFPTGDLYVEASKRAPSVRPSADEEEILTRLRSLRSMGTLGRSTPEQMTQMLRSAEPFDRVDNLGELVGLVWTEGDK
ncbi:ATP-binding protein [Herbiconiux sp. CPCC 205716]|uniref:ATP-binding protein n=1 Tax=Herbiconiux gentiana TaxID=2970912 RepID=A0ABT2GBE5_9MICO|nr:ATP-binding protein [Herbiconiux gentiana]MCS5713527.1 ATP-binding protein [Herbiconiux gentiana]